MFLWIAFQKNFRFDENEDLKCFVQSGYISKSLQSKGINIGTIKLSRIKKKVE